MRLIKAWTIWYYKFKPIKLLISKSINEKIEILIINSKKPCNWNPNQEHEFEILVDKNLN